MLQSLAAIQPEMKELMQALLAGRPLAEAGGGGGGGSEGAAPQGGEVAMGAGGG